MKKLNEAVLAIGDIILTTTTEPLSKGIRRVTGSDISHAMVYVEPYSVIDSTGDGVHSQNTQRLLWDDHCAVYVLRVPDGLADHQIQQIINIKRKFAGIQGLTPL